MIDVRLLGGLFALCAMAAPAGATDTWTTLKPGLRRLHRVTATQNINVLVVDLCAPGISVRATKESEHKRTVSSFGTLVGADAAINANFFNVTTFDPSGPVVANGTAWGGTDSSAVATALFGDYRVALPPDGATGGIQPWVTQAVSGHPTLLVDGVARVNTTPLCVSAAPRTALGLSSDGQTLYLAVIDGRATTRVGMSCNQVASLLKGLGARQAVNLDGGGSSTMWLPGSGVINHPSDGVERTVSAHLAIMAKGTGDATFCPAPRYLASLATPPAVIDLLSGASTDVTLELSNDGNMPWQADHTRIGTQDPQDRVSAFAAPDWISPARATGVAMDTAPGAMGRFTFTLVAPEVDVETSYVENFQLVQDDTTWFGPPMALSIVVDPAQEPPRGSSGGCNAGGAPGGAMLVLLVGLRRSRRERVRA